VVLRFRGLVKDDRGPRIKLEGDELYVVVPEGSKVQQRFLGWRFVYRIEHEGDAWCFKVKLSGSALGDWIEPLRPSERDELTASRDSRRVQEALEASCNSSVLSGPSPLWVTDAEAKADAFLAL